MFRAVHSVHVFRYISITFIVNKTLGVERGDKLFHEWILATASSLVAAAICCYLASQQMQSINPTNLGSGYSTVDRRFHESGAVGVKNLTYIFCEGSVFAHLQLAQTNKTISWPGARYRMPRKQKERSPEIQHKKCAALGTLAPSEDIAWIIRSSSTFKVVNYEKMGSHHNSLATIFARRLLLLDCVVVWPCCSTTSKMAIQCKLNSWDGIPNV